MIIETTLACYYIVYLISRSEFPPILLLRDRIFRRWGVGTWQAYLVACGWCMAIYVSAVVICLIDLVTDVNLPALLWLATATGTGLIAEIVDTFWWVREQRR